MKLKRGMLEGIQNQLETKMKISAKTVSLGNKKIKFVLLYTKNSSLEKKIKIEQNIKETKIIN